MGSGFGGTPFGLTPAVGGGRPLRPPAHPSSSLAMGTPLNAASVAVPRAPRFTPAATSTDPSTPGMTPGTREFALMEQEMLLGGTPGIPTPAALRLGTPAAVTTPATMRGVASEPAYQTPTPAVGGGTPAAMAAMPVGTPSMGVVHNFISNIQYDARPSSGTPAGTPSRLDQGAPVGGTPTLWGDLLNPAYGSIPEQQGVENDVKVTPAQYFLWLRQDRTVVICRSPSPSPRLWFTQMVAALVHDIMNNPEVGEEKILELATVAHNLALA